MNKIKKICLTVASVILATAMNSSHAAMVNFEFSGVVDYWADAGNDFGLAMGDTVTASGMFDDNVLTGGFGFVDFSSGSGNTLAITFGSMTFLGSDDKYYGSTGFPSLDIDPSLPDLDFLINQSGLYFSSTFDIFDAIDANGYEVNGTWDYSTLSITPVPVPAAVWLFGSGLLGLVGIARRKAA